MIVRHQMPVSIGDSWLAHTLLNQRVQKTEQFNRLPRPALAGKWYCAAASLLILATTTVLAGDPTLALTSNLPLKKTTAATTPGLMPVTKNSPANLKNSQSETSSQNMVAPSSGSPMENQSPSTQPESLQLIREDSHPEKSVSIQAGYGQIWDDQSILQKMSADHQEPSCAYVSANFSF